MIISLKEYKLLTLGKTTFNPGKFKIIVTKSKVEYLKSNAILHESGYFSPLWLDTEFAEGKPSHINIAYAKISGLDFSTKEGKLRAEAKLNSTANLLYNASQVVVLSPTELCLIFKTLNYNTLDYLLSTQNAVKYVYKFNVNRKEGFKVLDQLKEQVQNKAKPINEPKNLQKKQCSCGKNCNHLCKNQSAYLNSQVLEHVSPNYYLNEPEEE